MGGLNKLVILNMTYLYEKLPMKLLAEELKKKQVHVFKRLDDCFFLKYSFGELFFFNWYSLHARLNSHYEAWSYKKRKHKKVKGYGKSI